MTIAADQTIAEYFAAIRAMGTSGMERCVAAFAPDAEQHDPVGTPPNIGHPAIRAFFTQIFAGFEEVSLTEDRCREWEFGCGEVDRQGNRSQ